MNDITLCSISSCELMKDCRRHTSNTENTSLTASYLADATTDCVDKSYDLFIQ